MTASPLAQVREIFTYDGPAVALTAWPLTAIAGLGHQPGTRTYSGNASGPGALRVRVTAPRNG